MTKDQISSRKTHALAIIVSAINAIPISKVLVYDTRNNLHSSLYVDYTDENTRGEYLNRIFELDREVFTNNLIGNFFIDYMVDTDTYTLSIQYIDTTDIIEN